MKKKELTEIEWTTCWMSIRYAMNRQTISSYMLPSDLIVAYWNRWTDFQKEQIALDLSKEQNSFGDSQIDKTSWSKFWKACDTKNHKIVKLIDKTECIIFEANGRKYPLNEYIKSPYKEIFIEDESIIQN